MKTLYGPLKAEASGPEASPELLGQSSHGVAQAQASIRGRAFPVLSFPPHHACCETDDSHLSERQPSFLNDSHLSEQQPPFLLSSFHDSQLPLSLLRSSSPSYVSSQWTVVAHATPHYTQLRPIPGTQQSRTPRELKRAILSPLESHPPSLSLLGRPNCQPLSSTSPHRKCPRATLRAAIRIKHNPPGGAGSPPSGATSNPPCGATGASNSPR